ncbi:MAG: hypothetical protein UW95_C0001G0076 [Parcubacteria group bacterium GW2011_GWC1_45_14]|nr:MAG: hypothetical protein UW87_C0007G0010 [Candidatus Moranbacteria bacterium GW2011_GWC2_45_10]KKT95512.1 MAG: hypothetical protein UW95_C0001G0076 [Parcubacteria group bacterium GW2011_GWC1_45_14]
MPHVLALAGFWRLIAKIYTPLRCVSKFLHAHALESGNALRNVRRWDTKYKKRHKGVFLLILSRN